MSIPKTTSYFASCIQTIQKKINNTADRVSDFVNSDEVQNSVRTAFTYIASFFRYLAENTATLFRKAKNGFERTFNINQNKSFSARVSSAFNATKKRVFSMDV